MSTEPSVQNNHSDFLPHSQEAPNGLSGVEAHPTTPDATVDGTLRHATPDGEANYSGVVSAGGVEPAVNIADSDSATAVAEAARTVLAMETCGNHVLADP